MRLWSIHPMYLDTRGLTACWREALLARKVLVGATKGYKNHPQLQRFKLSPAPLELLEAYLYSLLEESLKRGFHYDASKVKKVDMHDPISVTDGQLKYEFEHLKGKLTKRDNLWCEKLLEVKTIEPHPIFKIVNGPVEKWEVIK